MRNEQNVSGTVRKVNDYTSNEKSAVRKHNIIPKILCVVAAFFLWLYVMQTETPENEGFISSVTVDMENSAELQSASGLSVYSRSGNIVDVKLRGKKSVIDKLKSEDIHAYIDVGTITTPGQHAVKVFVDLPEGVNLVEPQPSTISVYVDETSTISLDVSEKLDNLMLSSPYELGNIRFEYDSITVTGPKNKLAQIEMAMVDVNMKDKTSSFVTRSPIYLVDKSGKKIDMSYLITSVNEMDVTVPIYVNKEIPVKVDFKHGFLNADNAKVTLTPSYVTVKGDESKFVDVAEIIDTIIIDEKQIVDNSYTISLNTKANADVTVAEDDRTIKVDVELSPNLVTKRINVNDISVKGAPANVSYEIIDNYVNVILRGTLEDLSKVKPADVRLEVDLSAFGNESSGVVGGDATVIIDSEVADKIWEVGSYPVQIKIN